MICSECLQFVLVKSRIPNLCKKCERDVIQKAAKQVEFDNKTLSLADLVSKARTMDYKPIKGAKVK